MSITIYHNPRCSKSRACLARIEASSAPATIIPYLDQPPTAATIRDLARRIGCPVRALIRDNEALFRERFSSDDHDDDGWAAIISDHPKLLQRPIVVSADDAVVARPPELVDRLLHD
ncbi:MAG: arsenate reductase (glutaredoxin) [Planctomycetota bacterium]